MWAWIWLVGTYTSLIGMGEVLWQISRKGYLDVVDTIICVIFSMAGGLFILAAILWMMIFTGKMAGITIRGTDAGWFLAECAVRTILLIWENRVYVI